MIFAMNYTANSDYEEKDTEPLSLKVGDAVSVGHADRTWPGWVWASDGRGHDGYVPEEFLEAGSDGRWVARKAFDPTVLTVRRGEALSSLLQIHGWHWCRNAQGGEGWVAGYLLRPV